MHSLSSDGRRRAAVLALLAACLTSLPAVAGEARARGRKAVVRWMEADGSEREAHARKIAFVYMERVQLSVKRKGKNYKDVERRLRAVPAAGQFTPFSRIETIGFGWTDPAAGEPLLHMTLTLWDKTTLSVTGNELAGALHSVSPNISFTVDGLEHSIDLDPLRSEVESRGKARLLEISFYP